MRFSIVGCVCSTQTRVIFNPAVCNCEPGFHQITHSWVENNSSLSRTHAAHNTEPHLARFFILICRGHKTCRALFLAWCHHVVCSHIVDRPFWNIKLDRHLVPTGSFFVFQFADDVRDTYKTMPMKYQWKAIDDDFCRGCQYERLEGHLFLGFSAYHGN